MSDTLSILNSPIANYISFAVKFGVIVLCIYLILLFRGSLFLRIPVYLLLATISYTIHAIVELTLTGELEEILYALTALVTSIFILLLLASIVSALNQMIKPERSARDLQRESGDT